jgi:hypothetical protein
MFTDPSGEWFLLDDLASFATGGLVNVLFNLDKIDNLGEAIGYFAVGGVGTWISVQSFGLAAPVGGALISGGNAILDENVIAKDGSIDLGSINHKTWEKIGAKTLIGGLTAYAGDKLGNYLGGKVTSRLNVKSEFWNKATNRMLEGGISDGLSGYFESVIVDENDFLSKEAFSEMGKGLGKGAFKGLVFTSIEMKSAQPETQALEFRSNELVQNLSLSKNPNIMNIGNGLGLPRNPLPPLPTIRLPRPR